MAVNHLVVVASCLLLTVAYAEGQPTQCELLVAKAALEDRNVIVENSLKQLSGTWVSEECETRPGPEYILRVYTFGDDGYYKLIQHHYWDESCSSPKLTIMTFGHMRILPFASLHDDAASGTLKPINITVIPQDQKAAKELDGVVLTECRVQRWKPWRKYEEHVVYNVRQYQNMKPVLWNSSIFAKQTNFLNTNSQRSPQESSGDIRCLGSLKWSFEEMKLFKIQLRPSLKNKNNLLMRFELLTGDLHSRKDYQGHYSSTGFQIPLLKIVKGDAVRMKNKNFAVANTCNICYALFSSDKTPPHLIEKPKLPAYIWGEWVSKRCESRPMGLYLKRKFNFFLEDSRWTGEYKFYSDPFCMVNTFSVSASGHFSLTGPNTAIRGAHNLEFNLEQGTLTLYSSKMMHDLGGYKHCGTKYWEKGIAQDITETNGCLPLGIIIPSVQYDIVKVEMDYEGSCLLYLGQADTDNMPRTKYERPSSFDMPLVKCAEDSNMNAINQIFDYELYDFNHSFKFNASLFLILIAVCNIFR